MAGTSEAPNPADSSAQTGPFLSALSQENTHASPANPMTSRAHARVKLHQDENGVHYLVDPQTGNRYDISDDENVPYESPSNPTLAQLPQVRTPTAGTISDTSDINSGPQTAETVVPAEAILAALVTDLRTEPLTDSQLARFSALRGVLSVSRTALLTTTALVAGQRTNFREASVALRELRDEFADRIDTLSDDVVASTVQLESTLDNNLRILRTIGSTEEQLAQIAEAVKKGQNDPIRPVIMPPIITRSEAAETVLGDLQEQVDHALPPRGAHETHHEFMRRGGASVERRIRTADSFMPTDIRSNDAGPGVTGARPADLFTPAPRVENIGPTPFTRQARFDNSSISTAIRRAPLGGPTRTIRSASTMTPIGLNQSPSGYITAPHDGAGTVFEAFAAEKSEQIRRVFARHLGEAMEAPPRAPKINNPPTFKGEDDDSTFMTWFGKTCTWLQGYGLGGPRYEGHRILYLKSALDGHALEWFIHEVEPADRDSTIPNDFVEIICAMHRRFVTSATAQRATKEFEAIRYDAVRGIDHLVSELIRTANKMREPPADFTIRQRFMRLIPATVHDELIRRGLFPEYTDLELLKNHARSWIEAQSQMRGGSASGYASSPRTSASTTGPLRAPRPQATIRTGPARGPANRASVLNATKSAPVTSVRTNTSTEVRPRGPVTPYSANAHATRTCFGCGALGHLQSDPKCPNYNASASSRPRIGAQRVPESYSNEIDGTIEGDPDALPEDYQPGEEAEGLWGGSQYDADELMDFDHPVVDEDDDPNAAPGIEDVFDSEEHQEVRVGAMRQCYSIRVVPDDAPVLASNEPLARRPPVVTAAPRVALLDLRTYQLDVLDPATFASWTPEWEARHRVARPEPGEPSFERLRQGFLGDRAQVGHLDGPAAAELAAIEAIGIEEEAFAEWEAETLTQPPLVLGYTPAILRTTAINVDRMAPRLAQGLEEIRRSLRNLDQLLVTRAEARSLIEELRARPHSANESISGYLDAAARLNSSLRGHIVLNLRHLEQREERLVVAYADICDELARRLVLFEREHPATSTAASETIVPLATSMAPREGLDRTESPVTDISSDSGSDSAPSSSPPEYPGSPHDSDDYYSAEELERSIRVPSFYRAHNNESDSDEYEGPLSLAACRALTPWDYSTSEESLLEESDPAEIMVHESQSALGHLEDPKCDDSSMTLATTETGSAPQVRVLSQRIEHLSTIRRPRAHPTRPPGAIGLMDQPTRSSKTIACLSAVIKIGTTSAYALFDSGSNTDSMTPEFANAINGVRIPLDEQITLQLGCVGSRSKISFGTRVPVDFGGVRGYVYFDQVNLDRYDAVIGTPFMNRHGVVLDFGSREIKFPNGHVIKALSSLEEASLVASRHERPGKNRPEPKVKKEIE
ncbi:hypothetical protein B0H15DRAFT_947821 [Mycena belliarum]|uniref:Uncharacterized protein n=1 Tax=Mycena belliarum TaxID=1033014 RepID=A0AAD6XR26_9AGAR|nr:hypothetical protein B0H15DRAFT_947821 [Mycena belliae]